MTSRIDDEIKIIGARKRSVTLHGKPTSIYISDRDWNELQEIARDAGITAARVVTMIKAKKPANLTSAIRMYIVNHRRRQYSGG